MPRTMGYKLFKQRFLLLIHTKENPTDDEWKVYLTDVRQWFDKIEGFLVISEGGGPNTLQRGEMNDVLESKKRGAFKTAVVSLSRLVRGIVTALSWFNPGIKAFSTLNVSQALEYLEVPANDHDMMLAEIKRLKTELGIAG
jgi:hypothetical protein